MSCEYGWSSDRRWLCPECARKLRAERDEAYDANTDLRIAIHELTLEIGRMEAENARLRAVLEMVKWVKDSSRAVWEAAWLVCPWCRGTKTQGHASSCPRQKALNPGKDNS